MSSLPTQLGRYQVAGLLATGGMGEVLLGRDLGPHGFERPVVLKRILPHLARDPAFVAMFVDEARIVATIRHANVVQVHELMQHGDDLALVMEYLEGETAYALLRKLESRAVRLPSALAVHIAAAACAGLHAAHELTDASGMKRQVVHRDVSPQNLFITYDGQVKLIDFGIALAAGRSGKTETGQLKGKVSYMSPEQCSGESLDRRSDIFSLGAVLFELATGQRAFKRASDLLTMRAICEDPLVPPTSVVEDFPSELEAVIVRALSRRREDRFQTAAEMRRALLLVMRDLPAVDDTPDAVLGALMAELFEECITDKRDKLQKVARGETLPPATPDGALTRTATVWATRTRSRHRNRTWIVLGVTGTLATLGVAYQRLAGAPLPSAPPQTSAAVTVPSEPSAKPEAAVAKTVRLEVNSRPEGAEVGLEGRRLGTTPLDVRVRAEDNSAELRITHPGYQLFVERVRLDADQHLVVQLRGQASVSKAERPAPAKPPTASSAQPPRDFHAFD